MGLCDWQSNDTQFRYDKNIIAQEKDFRLGPSVVKVSSDGSLEDYCEEVLAFIKTLEASGKLTDYNQMAFLFRSVKNDKVIELANFLEENGVPVFSPRSSLFFERDEIRLLIGCFTFIFPTLFEDLKWSETASLGVWDYYEECKKLFATEIRSDTKKHAALLNWCRVRAKEHLTLTTNTNYAFAALLYQMLEFPMFGQYVEAADLSGSKINLRASYNIALFSKLLFKFEYLYNVTVFNPEKLVSLLQNFFNTYLRFIIDGGIEEYEDFEEQAPSGCVSFMTIHQSKGLEFPVVLVGSLNAVPRTQLSELDIILQTNYYSKPPFEPLDRLKFYDFYRLYYTAFSRAQNLLVLTAQEKGGSGKNPSKYLEPIYGNVPSWQHESFDMATLELEQIKPTNIKHVYSFTSHILLYENCPLQYKYFKELEFVEVRTGGVLGGSLLHQTIEDIHKAVLRKEEATLTNENITAWFNTNYYLLSKQLRSYLHLAQQKSLLKQVLRYRDNNQHQWDRIQEAEVDVSMVKEDYILKGTIDLIKGENDTVELIDFKSGDKPDVNSTEPQTRRIIQQYRRQLEVYAHLVEQRTGQTVSRMHLYYPKEDNGSPYVTFKTNRENIGATISTFDDVVKRIESKDYDMNNVAKSEKLCGNCDMRFHCNPKHY
jgi:DNA helicase-2/ATP-dependent DNA helicase PcrA